MKTPAPLHLVTLATSAVAVLGVAAPTSAADRCAPGFVWREARPDDHVCVTPQMRDQVAEDNSVAADRWTNGPFGSQTCVQGFVWREAFPDDHVCVTPQMRDLVAADNASASSRLAAYNCASCNDGSCQCGYDTKDDLCAAHDGVNPEVGCIQQPN